MIYIFSTYMHSGVRHLSMYVPIWRLDLILRVIELFHFAKYKGAENDLLRI